MGPQMNQTQYKQLLLDSLFAPYKNCTLCPLSTQGRTTVVFGEGNPNANLMLIGEGPGKEEDKQGRPFVGRSGKFLTKILTSLGISRKEIYIANIVKCRPPKNRAPLLSELSICKKILLEKQIKIIQPKIICSLGAYATNALLNQKIAITKIRGTTQLYQGVQFLPTFHPAYVLRNTKELQKLTLDLETAFNLSIADILNNKSAIETKT